MTSLSAESSYKDFNQNVEQLFKMVWGKGQPIQNVELGNLVEDTRVSYLMMNKLQRAAFSDSPTWLLDSLDLIEDSMGIRDEHTVATLMFNSHRLPKLDEIQVRISQLDSSLSNAPKLGDLLDQLDDLEYKMFTLHSAGEDQGISDSIDNIMMLMNNSQSHDLPVSNNLSEQVRTLKSAHDNFLTDKSSIKEVITAYTTFSKYVEDNQLITKLKNKEIVKNLNDEVVPVERTNQFADSLIAAIHKESSQTQHQPQQGQKNTNKPSINPIGRKF